MRKHMDWRSRAACRHIDPELFFPEGSAGPALQATELAKQVCGTCPVQTRCLIWAFDHSAGFGIWGGHTEDERRSLRRALAQPGYGQGSRYA